MGARLGRSEHLLIVLGAPGCQLAVLRDLRAQDHIDARRQRGGGLVGARLVDEALRLITGAGHAGSVNTLTIVRPPTPS